MAKVTYIGRIVDREKHAPISNAKISIGLPGKELIVYTDLEGIYKFSLDFGNSVLEGEIRVEAKNYKTYSAFLRLSPQNKDLGDIRLVYPHYQGSDRNLQTSVNSSASSESNIALPLVAVIMIVFALLVAAMTLPSSQDDRPQEIPENTINLQAPLNISGVLVFEGYCA
jgi:ABC-type Na+ efflux pump permease subunit